METEEPVDTLRWVSLTDIVSNNNIPVSMWKVRTTPEIAL